MSSNWNKMAATSSNNNNFNWENSSFTKFSPSIVRGKTEKYKDETTRKTVMKKKCKRFRTAFTTEQLHRLEQFYCQNKYIDAASRQNLSEELNIAETAVKTWFQNRRMKEKREDTETSDVSSDDVPTPSPTPRHSAVDDKYPRLTSKQYESTAMKKDFVESNRSPDLMPTNPAHGNVYSPSSFNEFSGSNYNLDCARPASPQYEFPTFSPPFPVLTAVGKAFCGESNTVYHNHYFSGVETHSDSGVVGNFVSL